MAAIDEFGLADRVVAVTGAGRGIGRAIALASSRSGAKIAVASRTGSELESLAEEIDRAGGSCATLAVDLGQRSGIEHFVEHTVSVFGRIDALVNNAGTNLLKDAIDFTDEEIATIFELNLASTYYGCVAAARQMMSQGGGGTIVNISSQVGVVGGPGRAPYSAAKAGVNNLTRSLAAEWAAQGIRVNAVAPTVTATPLAKTLMKERPEFFDDALQRIPLGRLAEVEDIAYPVVFLLSDAAAMITGHTLVVDGGWTIT